MLKKDDDKVIYCYSCRKKSIFTRRDVSNNSGVESHCSECEYMWFEWQNRAVEREKEKWLEYNGGLRSKFKLPNQTSYNNS
ncbi:hypothetical protein [Psychrobacillus antarcticus]|uniref:hypothetical protein n=1 Tax=Psychrobacillus antarcticus TaxID=2879115 RepID=UPI00240823B6|nr:hypothetical protein [Psychrobacillus antarcticus]